MVVGSPVAGRTRREVEGLIGLFVNTLVLRTDLRGTPTFSELLARVREVAWDAFEHQDVPFEKLVEELSPARSLSRHPLFQVLLAVQNVPAPALAIPGMAVYPESGTPVQAKFDLEFQLAESLDAEGRPAGLLGEVTFAVIGLLFLIADVRTFCGTATPNDDVTIVVVRYDGTH